MGSGHTAQSSTATTPTTPTSTSAATSGSRRRPDNTSRCGCEGITSPPTIQKIDPLIGNVVISEQAFDRSFPRPQNQFSFADMDGGATDANTAALKDSVKDFSDAKLETKAGWVDTRSGGVDQLLNLLYVSWRCR